MGTGPFNVNRPFTAGDDGVLGLNRPLVGAANGVAFSVTTDSAKQVVKREVTPKAVFTARRELEKTKIDLKNKREQITRFEEGLMDRAIQIDPRTRGPLPLQRLQDAELSLELKRDNLGAELQRYEDYEYSNERAAQRLEDVLEIELEGLGISRGPRTVTKAGDRIEVSMTMVGINEAEAIDIKREMEELGLVVTGRELFEVTGGQPF